MIQLLKGVCLLISAAKIGRMKNSNTEWVFQGLLADIVLVIFTLQNFNLVVVFQQ